MPLFLGSQECICWHHQPLNCLVHEGKAQLFMPFNCLVHEGMAQLFMPLKESWVIMFVEETHHKAWCFGPIVPGYNAYILLNLLQLVDQLDVLLDSQLLCLQAVEQCLKF